MTGPVYRAVVVDDEPTAREAVRTLLREVSEIEVVGEAASGDDAVRVVRREAPDLLFLDIQMPDRDGFRVVEALGDQLPRGIVFVTAHSEHAQRAFEVRAMDYVVKPFGKPRFLKAVTRAIHRLEAEDALAARETLRSLLARVREPEQPAGDPAPTASDRPSPDRIGIRIGSRTVLVAVNEIDWVEADGDLLRLHVGEKTHLLNSSLSRIEDAFASRGFVRIHRSTLVNTARIQLLERERDGGGVVRLVSGVRLRVARGRWSQLEGSLGLDSAGD